jgi:hypothetical protein
MSVFDEKRTELEQHEFMMGVERGRLAVALDLLTDSLILVGQHGVYCVSSRNPNQPALDLQAVLGGMRGGTETSPHAEGPSGDEAAPEESKVRYAGSARP